MAINAGPDGMFEPHLGIEQVLSIRLNGSDRPALETAAKARGRIIAATGSVEYVLGLIVELYFVGYAVEQLNDRQVMFRDEVVGTMGLSNLAKLAMKIASKLGYAHADALSRDIHHLIRVRNAMAHGTVLLKVVHPDPKNDPFEVHPWLRHKAEEFRITEEQVAEWEKLAAQAVERAWAITDMLFDEELQRKLAQTDENGSGPKV